MIKQLISLYEYFFRATSGNAQFVCIPTAAERKLITKFVSVIPDIASEDWMFDYLVFQFGRYYDLKTRYGKGVILISWVLGQKAMDAWKARTEQQLYYTQKFKIELGLEKKKDFTMKLSEDFLNAERERFHNTEQGFLNCQELELKKQKNRICITCKFKKYCNE